MRKFYERETERERASFAAATAAEREKREREGIALRSTAPFLFFVPQTGIEPVLALLQTGF
jgi:hypothetical protein